MTTGNGIKTIEVEIKGTAPLLIHRFGEEAEQAGVKGARPATIKHDAPRVAAEKVAYIAKDGTYYFNAASIPGCMKVVGANYKQKSNRKSLRYIVPAAIRMTTDAVTINNGSGKPAKDFEVDSRPVTIPSTKGRIMRHRPRFDQWSAKFDLLINTNLMELEMAHQLLGEAGQQCGIGDYRPDKGGPFGCFQVVSWKEAKEKR